MKEYGKLTKAVIERLNLAKRTGIKDIAPWVGQLIEELEKNPDVELFSVSPQIKMAKSVQSFLLGRTTYYFYSTEYSSLLRLLKKYPVWRALQNCGSKVMKIAEEIKPDVVIAYGTENPVVSVPQLWLRKKYPVICVLQTIYNNPERVKYSTPNPLIQDLEHDIVKNVRYFGMGGRLYYDLLKGMNSEVIALEYPYPSAPLPNIPMPCKKYDFVNYAFNLDARKGDEDAVRALAIVKKTHPDVTLNMAGGMNPTRKTYIEGLIAELGLQENVSFTPMFERKEDMYAHVLEARYALLPVKLDLVSTTTRESMYYGLPVITNITPATPLLNKDKQCVLLAEKGNIDSLAKCMLEVIENVELAKTLSENGHEYMVRQMDNGPKMRRILTALQSVIDNYKEGVPVPQELLFDIEKHQLMA
jgi:glycosyltransferase involved in cell wall biosynthesis